MKWVVNPYDETFTIVWNGETYLLEKKTASPLPDDVVRAFIMTEDVIEPLLPADEKTRMFALREIVEVYLSRWRGQIEKVVKIGGTHDNVIRQVSEFMEKFEIYSEKPTLIKDKAKINAG